MKDLRFAKFLVLVNCAVPVTLLGLDAWQQRLGANPVNFSIRTTGILSLVFLVLSLTTTPIGRMTGWHWLTHFRRTLGLYAFFHTLLHFLMFFTFDRALSVRSTLSEMAIRPYLTVGSLGLLVMVPLAVTSTNAMIKRLGSTRWKRLHRLAYVAAIAGVTHYYMLVKADVRQPIAFAIVLGVLLCYRLINALIKHKIFPKSQSSATTVSALPKPKFWSGQLKVARIFVETPDVRTFRFVPIEGTSLPFDYLPGQYLNVSLVIDGRKVNRSYTIASAPTRSGYCEITVKRESHGTASKHLHDHVQAGDLINISAPAGRFTFTGTEATGIVMLAGGVGITPLMSKIRFLTDRAWPGRIDLIFCVRTEADIIFREELEYLQNRHPNLQVTVTLTRTMDDAWPGERGRISAEMLSRLVPHLGACPVHFCGPEEMNQSLRRMLPELGVPDAMIRFESFATPNRIPLATEAPIEGATISRQPQPGNMIAVIENDSTTPSLTFVRSGKSAAVSADKTVLDIAEELGVNLDFDCRAGICGTCKVKRLSGHVLMDSEDGLTDVDRTGDLILSCQAHCLDEVIVDL